jgi:hypothetical protein
MRRALLACLTLLLPGAGTAHGRPVVVAATVDGAPVAAPAILPFDFGSQPLGVISTLEGTLCFEQGGSTPGSCDVGGTLGLVENVASPFFLAGAFRENLASGSHAPVSFPVTLQPGQRLRYFVHWASDRLSPVDDLLRLRVTPSGSGAQNFDVQLSGDGVPATCVNGGGSLCLVGDRFQVQSVFLTSAALEGGADTVRLTDETGYLYFFSPSNVEAVIKVLNACPVNNRYWVFAGGLTNVRTLITVTDTLRNSTKIYVNPQGTPFQPIQDTSAFATCP